MSVVSGCTMGEDPKPVDVLLQNNDTEEWPITVIVVRDTDEEVFQREETIPPGTGVVLGEVPIKNAFEGTVGDQFTVRVRLNGESAGTFDYEITCNEDNRFSLLVEHRPYSSGDGEPIDYVSDRCGG
jgi:hypothetical protein